MLSFAEVGLERRRTTCRATSQESDTKTPTTPDGPRGSEGFVLRKLYHKPRVAVDWSLDYEEEAADWWELFVDLILVVACSNSTDALYESNGSLESIFYFLLTVNLIQSGWLMHMNYGVRFEHEEESLAYSAENFVFMLGLAGMAIHVEENEFISPFIVCILLQRIGLLLMYGGAAAALDRGAQHMRFLTATIAVSMAICIGLLLSDATEFTPLVMIGWTAILAIELPSDAWGRQFVPAQDLVPINIDHFVDRLGALIMICLGESLLSAMVTYGAVPEEQRTATFYISLALVLLLAFTIALIHYNIRPSREFSALRGPVWRGYTVYFSTAALATSILLIGVGIKYSMFAIVYDAGAMSAGKTWLLCGSVSATLLLITLKRAGHYWGKQPSPEDSEIVRNIKWAWWSVLLAWPLIPLVVAAVTVRPETDALWTLGFTSGSCLGLVLVETAFTNWIADIESTEIVKKLEESQE